MDREISDSGSAAGYRVRALRRSIHLLVAVGGILVMLACYSQQVTRLSAAPASTLFLTMGLDYEQVPSPDKVRVTVNVASNKSPGAYVIFSGGQSLTVNGVRLSESNSRVATIPRQPPGGHYTLVYTDEHGTHTRVDIPAPQATFAVIEPASGAQVPLPGREASVIPTTTPMPTPTPTTISSRSPDGAHTPVVVRYAVPYMPSALPTSPLNQTPNGSAEYKVIGSLSGTCAPQWPGCPPVSVGSDDATGILTFRDWYLPYGQGFECFSPGPGKIGLTAHVKWYMPHAGFASLSLDYIERVDSPVRWVRT